MGRLIIAQHLTERNFATVTAGKEPVFSALTSLDGQCNNMAHVHMHMQSSNWAHLRIHACTLTYTINI